MWEGIPVKRLTPKSYLKAFQVPERATKHQLTCPFQLTSGSFLIGRRRLLVILRNHSECLHSWNWIDITIWNYVFSGCQKNERITLKTNRCTILTLLDMWRRVLQRISVQIISFNSFWTNKSTTLHLLSKLWMQFFNDLKSTLLSSVALWFRKLTTVDVTRTIVCILRVIDKELSYKQ